MAFATSPEPKPQDLSAISLPPTLHQLATDAKQLFQDKLAANAESDLAFVVTAPGRVNLIGEHTDYTGGFVLPLAIEYSTVAYGTGRVTTTNTAISTKVTVNFVSATNPDSMESVAIDASTSPPAKLDSWKWYVMGTVAQYLPDLPPTGVEWTMSLAIAGNVPLGSGLSSSASLEVAVARFAECILGDQYAFSSESKPIVPAKVRALRAQKAENVWCHSPCGIMDQYISSAASSTEQGTLLCIDCRSYECELVHMKMDSTAVQPAVLVVANSAVTHSIGDGEYPIRVQQCKEATASLQKVHGDDRIQSLRDANIDDVLAAKGEMDDVTFRRARHVVTENARVLTTKAALKRGDWKTVGEQMQLSHVSMRDDYETSCEEVDILQEIARSYDGVYGSRLTGGGFGGCVLTLVDKAKAKGLMEHIQKEYQAKTGKDCKPFETTPAPGARVLAVDAVSK